MRSSSGWNFTIWQRGQRDKHSQSTDKSFEWREMLESLLAHNVVAK
jgi:hypothetical protein